MTDLPSGRFTRRATFKVDMTAEQRALFDQIVTEGHFENQARLDFLERMSGLTFEILDDVEEYR